MQLGLVVVTAIFCLNNAGSSASCLDLAHVALIAVSLHIEHIKC